jgi:hypothetical protein
MMPMRNVLLVLLLQIIWQLSKIGTKIWVIGSGRFKSFKKVIISQEKP